MRKLFLVVSFVSVFGTNVFAIEFQHTAKGVVNAPARSVEEAPATSVAQPEATPAQACVNCNQGMGVTKSVEVSVPETNIRQQVYKVDCVKMEYRDETYTDYEPKQYTRTENYSVQVNVPYTATGTQKLTGYKPISQEYQYTVCVPKKDACGCVRWVRETRTGVKTAYEPYSYDRAYEYQANRVEERVASREVAYTRMEPVERVRQIPTVVPDARYVEKTTHTATYTITTTYQNEIPKSEGEALYRKQNTAK